MAERKLSSNNPYVFRVAECQAYMKKVRDGRCITFLSGDETESGRPTYMYLDTRKKSENGSDIWMKEVEEYDASLEFVKTYYQRIEKRFTGIIVGIKEIAISAWLYVDTSFDYNGCDNGQYVGKQVKERKTCAHVYYGSNKSRLVPLEDLKILGDEV